MRVSPHARIVALMTTTARPAGYTEHHPLDVEAILAASGPVYNRFGETVVETPAPILAIVQDAA